MIKKLKRVKEIGTHRLLLEKLNPKVGDTNITLLLPRIPMNHKSKHFPCTVSRLQFPIKIAYCLTIKQGPRTISVKMRYLVTQRCMDAWSNICCIFQMRKSKQHIYVWAEQSQFDAYNLPKNKKYVKNVVYEDIIRDGTLE